MDTSLADQVVAALEDEGLLAAEHAPRARELVRDALAAPRPTEQAPGGAGSPTKSGDPKLPRLVEVLAYLGAALVVAAVLLFAAQSWNDLSAQGQVAALAGGAAVLLVAGVASAGAGAGMRELLEVPARRRLAGTLLTTAGIVGGFAVGRWVDLLGDFGGSDAIYWPGFAGSVFVLAAAILAYRVAHTAVGIIAILGSGIAATGYLTMGLAEKETLVMGVTVFVFAVVFLAATEAGAFVERTIARTLGVATALFGAQFLIFEDDFQLLCYGLTLAVAILGVALYLLREDWPYLTVAVIATTLVVPEALTDWTGGSLGLSGGVLVTGITLLAASFLGYRLRAETLSTPSG